MNHRPAARFRPHRVVSGAASPQLVLFVALLALLLIGAAAAWLVLRDDGTDLQIPERVAEREGEPGEVATPEPASVPPTPTITTERGNDWKEEMKRLEGTTFLRKDLKTGKAEPMTTWPLHGTVVDDRNGERVYYFTVYLIPTDRGDPMTARSSWSPSHFRNGEFRLEHQPAGSYHLIVESREHEPVTRTIQVPYEDGPLEVRLHHGSCIRGVVRDVSQVPLKDIEVHLGVDPARIDGGAPPPMQRIAKTDENGRYSFWKVPAGIYSLTVSLAGDPLANEPEFRLDRGGEVLRDFTLERFGTLKLTVTNAAEQPVARARVILIQERDGRDRPVRTTYSDLKGVARLDFVREGAYKLKVQLQGFQTHEEPVSVAAGQGFRELPVRLEVATAARNR